MGAALSKCLVFLSSFLQIISDERRAYMVLASSSSVSAKQEADMKADWTKMIPELVELISDRLPLQDFIAFRGVCRHWRLAPSGRSEITKFSKDQPWLMLYGTQNSCNGSGACYLYSHSHSRCCTVYMPQLQGATVMESKFGWLLAHHGEHFFLVNVYTHEEISLPKQAAVPNQACTFTTLPTNKDCTVFTATISSDSVVELSSCRIHLDNSWTVRVIAIMSRDISKDVVDSFTGVYCCSCSYDHSHCKCHLKNKIGIFGVVNWLYYDYVDGKVTGQGQRRGSGGKRVTWFSEIINANGSDWLARFGGKAISVSMCARSFSDGTTVGWSSCRGTHTASGEHEPNAVLKDIKAAAIDPPTSVLSGVAVPL